MTGEEVAVLVPVRGDADAYGNATTTWTAQTVPGCVVRPLNGSDARDAQRPDGVTVSCTVALPKAHTAAAGLSTWRGCRVALVERGMDANDPEAALRVSGAPFRTVPCPTSWDVVLECGRADG